MRLWRGDPRRPSRRRSCRLRSDKAEISELCGADHLNDPVILGRWLANKTPEIVASRISRPGNSVLVAVENDSILAVGSVTDTGEITLNYVSPDARFRGASRALLVALETRGAGSREQAMHPFQHRNGS